MKRILKAFKHDVRKDYFWWKVIKGIDACIIIPTTKVYQYTVVCVDKLNVVMERYNFPPSNPLATEYAYELHYLNKISKAMRRKHIIECSRRKRMKVGIVTINTNVINPIYGYGG